MLDKGGRALYLLMLFTIPLQAVAQESAAARKQAGSWFFDTHDAPLDTAARNKLQDSYLARMGAISPDDGTVWEMAAKKAPVAASYQDVVLALPNFRPLFDLKDQVVAGAVAKYAKRLEQVPAKAIREWRSRTGRDELTAAMSLTAEDVLFPANRFSEPAFQAFLAKFK